MNISERIFERLRELSMSQKEFSDKTSIRQTTISEWKVKHTNPAADKIMIICQVLDVTPEWLLSGTDVKPGYRNPIEWYVIDKQSEPGHLLRAYNDLNAAQRARLMGYLEALSGLEREGRQQW